MISFYIAIGLILATLSLAVRFASFGTKGVIQELTLFALMVFTWPIGLLILKQGSNLIKEGYTDVDEITAIIIDRLKNK
jgi:hypothetical protein